MRASGLRENSDYKLDHLLYFQNIFRFATTTRRFVLKCSSGTDNALSLREGEKEKKEERKEIWEEGRKIGRKG